MKRFIPLVAASALIAGAHADASKIASEIGTAEGALEHMLEGMLRPQVMAEKHVAENSAQQHSETPEADASLPTDDDERMLHESSIRLPGLEDTPVRAISGAPGQVEVEENDNEPAEDAEEDEEEAEPRDDEQVESDGESDGESDDEDGAVFGEPHEEEMDEVEEPQQQQQQQQQHASLPEGLEHALMSALLGTGGAIHPATLAALPADHPLVIHFKLLGGHPALGGVGGEPSPMHVPFHMMPFHMLPMHFEQQQQMHGMHALHPMLHLHMMHMMPPAVHMMSSPMHVHMMFGNPMMHMFQMHAMPPMGMMMHGLFAPPHLQQLQQLQRPPRFESVASPMHHGMDLAAFLGGLEDAIDGRRPHHQQQQQQQPQRQEEVEEITFHNGVGTVHRFGTRPDGSKFDIVEPLHNDNQVVAEAPPKVEEKAEKPVLTGKAAMEEAIKELNA
jgi:hypothetical protein